MQRLCAVAFARRGLRMPIDAHDGKRRSRRLHFETRTFLAPFGATPRQLPGTFADGGAASKVWSTDTSLHWRRCRLANLSAQYVCVYAGSTLLTHRARSSS